MIAVINILSKETWTLIVVIFGLLWYYAHRQWQYLKELNIPHDSPSISQLGHMGLLLGKKTAFAYDNDMKKKHGPIWGAYSMLSPSITIHDPDMLRQIFIKDFHSFPVRKRTLSKINGAELNQGLTVTEGAQWKRIRSSLTPTFSASKIRQMTYIIDRCVGNAADAFDRLVGSNQGVFNARKIFSRLSLDIICSAAFSTEVNSQDDTQKEPEISRRARSLFNVSLFNPLPIICLIYPPFERVLEFFNYSLLGRENMAYFRAVASHVIEERKAKSGAETTRVDLLQLMLNGEISAKEAKSNKLEKGLDRNEIIGNAMVMILAGFENTGNTLSFLAYNLAQHPRDQKQVQDEIDEIYEKKGAIDYDSVREMKYLEMCVNESLRIYNPVLRNSRTCDKQITINGVTIPKGMTINVPAFALSHDPDYWDEPELFKPERMTDMSRVDGMVYQPFGGGPRNCIAMRFALMEIKLSMALLLHRYSFVPSANTPKPPLKLAFGVTVKSAVDYDLRVVRRNTT